MQQRTKPIDGRLVQAILKAIGNPPTSVYHPSDDSFLMLDTISDTPVEGKEVLDLGTGSGILGLYCALRGAQVTVADVDETAVKHALKAAESLNVNLTLIVSDLFSNVKGRFDLVLFNPPYLPSTDLQDPTVDGGAKGTILTEKFLKQLPNHLKSEGFALLLMSSLNNPADLIARYPKFDFTVSASRKLFFEEIQALNVSLRRNLS